MFVAAGLDVRVIGPNLIFVNNFGYQGNVKPYLAVYGGELFVEPLPDLLFEPNASRLELTEVLGQAEGFETTIHQEDGATLFLVRGDEGTVLLVFDDDTDRLVTIVPVDAPGNRIMN